jgi:probable rRNA maturation factor
MNLDISIDHKNWKSVASLRKLTKTAIKATISDDDVSVSVLFTGDAEILEVNKQWRGKAYATNVLSFPVSPTTPVPDGEPRPLGDIILAYGVIAKEAAEQKKTIANHVAHLIVHGTLHLLGYDHEDDGEASIMEAREIEILTGLGIENPYRS